MLENGMKIDTQMDAIDALNQLASTLRGLGFMCVALCEDPSVKDEDVFGLISDVAYYCAETSKKASAAIYESCNSIAPVSDAPYSLGPIAEVNFSGLKTAA